MLRHPGGLTLGAPEVVALDRLDGGLPQIEHTLRCRVGPTTLYEVPSLGVVLELYLQCAGLATVGELDPAAARHVVRPLADRADCILQRQVAHDDPCFDHPQHEVRRTD